MRRMPAAAPSRPTDADPPDDREQDGIAGPAGPLNGRGPADDPLEIPEFLRRAH